MSRQGKRTLRVYDTYNFIDKDPIIDEMRTALNDSGMSVKYVSALSNVSAACLSGWFGGKTRSPQNATASAFMGALGYERKWVSTREAKARASTLAQKKKLKNGKGSAT